MTTRERTTKKSGEEARSPQHSVDAPDAASERRRRIAEAAYYNAERRGFAGNREVEDWLEAEKQVDSTAAGREAQQTAPAGTAENGASPARKERRRAAPRGTRRATADRTAR